MNDDENQHGAWWGNLETIHPGEEQPDYDYVDNDDDKRKKFILVAAIVGIILMLLLGGVTAFTVLSGNKNAETQKKEQTQTPSKKKTEKKARKKKTADAKSSVFVMITADGAEDGKEATISVVESGKNGKAIVSGITVAVNETVKVCKLPKGKYMLTVDSTPDGYDKPAKSTSFNVKGDGKKVSSFAFLAKHVDKTAENNETDQDSGEQSAASDEQKKDETSGSQEQNVSPDNSSANSNSGTQSSASGGGSVGGQSSSSTPTTTKTIHHPAETQRVAICDTCGADITNDIDGHKKSTGHPWYHYEAKVIKEAWDETVTVN